MTRRGKKTLHGKSGFEPGFVAIEADGLPLGHRGNGRAGDEPDTEQPASNHIVSDVRFYRVPGVPSAPGVESKPRTDKFAWPTLVGRMTISQSALPN